MDQKLFAELLESANEALEHAKGKRGGARECITCGFRTER